MAAQWDRGDPALWGLALALGRAVAFPGRAAGGLSHALLPLMPAHPGRTACTQEQLCTWFSPTPHRPALSGSGTSQRP